MPYLSIYVLFISPSMMASGLIRVVANGKTSVLLKAEQYFVYTYRILFTHTLIDI